MSQVIVLSRVKLYPCVARPGPAWQWLYGTHLASLRGHLKRRYRNTPITCDWKAAAGVTR